MIEYALIHKANNSDGRLKCPCKRCCNMKWLEWRSIVEHCVGFGLQDDYDIWTDHGEENVSHRPSFADDPAETSRGCGEDIRSMLEEIMPTCLEVDNEGGDMRYFPQDMGGDTTTFMQYVKDAEEDLWHGNKEFTVMSFLVTILHAKSLYGWSDTSFTALLKIFKRAMPKKAKCPEKFSQCKKIIASIGCSMEKIDACLNDCILFWDEHKDRENCVKCGTSRWKKKVSEQDEQELARSEERRVGKECRSRWSPYH